MDVIMQLVIIDFSINLHVRMVLDPTDCPWLTLAPVLHVANVPMFCIWRSPNDINETILKHPFMKYFTPPSTNEASLALQNPPAGKPCKVFLCYSSQVWLHPDYSTIGDSTPPFGPYQLPHETRVEFFTHREQFHDDALREETPVQKQWHLKQETHVQSGNPPFRHTPVFLWVKAELIYPFLPPRWAGYEYRHAIPPVAYKSLWMVHPTQCRQYNAFYDEWDLWFPARWEVMQDESLAFARMGPSVTCLAVVTAAIALPNEHALLNPLPEDCKIQEVTIAENFFLHSWYSITLTDTCTFSNMDYVKWDHDPWHLFGEMCGTFTSDKVTRKCLVGWVSAVMEHDWDSRALKISWDLDSQHPYYIFGAQNIDPCLSISVERQCPLTRDDNPNNNMHWVLVRFKRDPETQPWSLLTSTMGVLLII